MKIFKKFNGSWQAFVTVAAVMVLAGTLPLLAAEKADRGYLGVAVQRLGSTEREKLGVKYGVEVIRVEKESGAAKAGIKEDDIIQLVNGEKIRDPQALVDVMAELAPGAAVKIGLWRDGKGQEVTAILDKFKGSKHFSWDEKRLPHIIRSNAYLGIVLQELNPDLAAYFNVKKDEGVLIVQVEKETPAGKAGLKAGDVIVQMGEKTVADAGAVHEALADIKKGEAIDMVVIRHGKKEKIKAEPDFNRRKRVIRIYRGGKDMGNEDLEINDLDIDVPGMDIEVPPLPDMSTVDEALHRVHEKLDRAEVRLEKHLEKVSENFWI
jgi:C-terminal processing protease CtpA/Prc